MLLLDRGRGARAGPCRCSDLSHQEMLVTLSQGLVSVFQTLQYVLCGEPAPIWTVWDALGRMQR